MKNYIGQNKVWDSNLIAYADGALSQNRSGMPSVWTSMNMGGDRSLLPCTQVNPHPKSTWSGMHGGRPDLVRLALLGRTH